MPIILNSDLYKIISIYTSGAIIIDTS